MTDKTKKKTTYQVKLNGESGLFMFTHWKTNGRGWVKFSDGTAPTELTKKIEYKGLKAVGKYRRKRGKSHSEFIGEVTVTRKLSRMQIWRNGKTNNRKGSVMTKLCRVQ